KANSAEPCWCELHRFQRHWRTGFQLYGYRQRSWPAQAAQSHPETSGPADDYAAPDCLRRLRERSRGTQQLQIKCTNRTEKAMAELDLKERQAGDVTILDLSGEVRIGDSSVALRDSVRSLADQGKVKLLLNLAGVKYIDSTGIGELIANYTTVKRQGGQLKLLNLTDRIQNLLVITKLLTVFDAYDNEAEALKSFE